MKPESSGWRRLTDNVQDTWWVSGEEPSYTYPSLCPKMRLDYIFVSPDLKVLKAEVMTKTLITSDHLPLKATISYR